MKNINVLTILSLIIPLFFNTTVEGATPLTAKQLKSSKSKTIDDVTKKYKTATAVKLGLKSTNNSIVSNKKRLPDNKDQVKKLPSIYPENKLDQKNLSFVFSKNYDLYTAFLKIGVSADDALEIIPAINKVYRVSNIQNGDKVLLKCKFSQKKSPSKSMSSNSRLFEMEIIVNDKVILLQEDLRSARNISGPKYKATLKRGGINGQADDIVGYDAAKKKESKLYDFVKQSSSIPQSADFVTQKSSREGRASLSNISSYIPSTSKANLEVVGDVSIDKKKSHKATDGVDRTIGDIKFIAGSMKDLASYPLIAKEYSKLFGYYITMADIQKKPIKSKVLFSQIDNQTECPADSFCKNIIYASLKVGNVELEIYRYPYLKKGKSLEHKYFYKNGLKVSHIVLYLPVSDVIVSSPYGMRRHPIFRYRKMHSGVDFRGNRGTPVMSVSDGIVKSITRNRGYGVYVVVEHNNRYSTLYAHLSQVAGDIIKNVFVRKGQIIGFIGSSGFATGNHLHYEVRDNDVPIDPGIPVFMGRVKQGDMIAKEHISSFVLHKKNVDNLLQRFTDKT